MLCRYPSNFQGAGPPFLLLLGLDMITLTVPYYLGLLLGRWMDGKYLVYL